MILETSDIFLAAGALASAGALAAPYATLELLGRVGRPIALESHPDAPLPRVSVLIPAHDEGARVSAKIEETLALDYPRELLEIVVGDDGSTDDTFNQVMRFAGRGVRVLTRRENKGKWATVRELVGAARHDLVVLTDCGATLEPGALRALVRPFQDARVGAVSGRYVVASDASEADYWGAATNNAARRGARGALLGAHGALWAARRDLLAGAIGDRAFINDDYVMPMRIRAAGALVAYAHDAVAAEPPTPPESLRARWVRVAFGNWQMIAAHPHMLSPTRGRAALALWAKLGKTAGPLALLALAACALALVALHPLLAAAILPVAMLGVASARFRALADFGLRAQAAYLEGFARWIGRARPSWGGARGQAQADIPLTVAFAKRAIDILGALVGIALGAPIMLACAIAIRASSKGPILFRQERVRACRDGQERTFTMLKFRTMGVDAETKSGPVWAVDDDPRVTRVGKILRRARLDELPQFFNVLSGDMSLVGPRPERPHFTSQLREVIPAYDDRVTALKPGITGLAQIRCGYDTSVDSVRDKLTWDMAYAAHLYRPQDWAAVEASILLETVVVALTGRGAK
jgi:lipopolysaccharide/colanic/teichoic acid biosynthesis glycosyltransferase